MKPELEAYLREHGATYALQALRAQLIAAGYDPVEVDAALREWQARATAPASAVTDRRRFWRWALGLHAAVLAVIGILSLAIGSFATNWGLLVVLAVVLLIGAGISGLIGRGATQGSSLAFALLVPAISALLIGGSCLALGGYYLLRAPPRTGIMEIHVEDPLSFDGSGTANCQDFGGTGGFVVWADDLGTVDGSTVGASIDGSPLGVPGGVAPSRGHAVASLSITLSPKSGEQPIYYSNIFSTLVDLDASSDGRSGTLRFEGLEQSVGDAPPGANPDLEPISGTISWTCE